MKRAFLCLLLLAATPIATRADRLPAPDYWMFSWVMKSGNYHYAIVPAKKRDEFLDSFKYSNPSILNRPDLEKKLSSLPKGATIAWGNATCLGINYPPADIMRKIERFSQQSGLNVLILPGRCP